MTKWQKGYNAGYLDGIVTTIKFVLGIVLIIAYIVCVALLLNTAIRMSAP